MPPACKPRPQSSLRYIAELIHRDVTALGNAPQFKGQVGLQIILDFFRGEYIGLIEETVQGESIRICPSDIPGNA